MHTQTHKHKQIAFNWCRCRSCEFTATLKYFPTATTIAAAYFQAQNAFTPLRGPLAFTANPSPNPPTCQPNAPSTASPRPFRSFVQLATGTATATATTTLLHSCLSLLLHVHCKKESKLWGFLKEMLRMSIAYRSLIFSFYNHLYIIHGNET